MARYIERCSLSQDKLCIDEDVITYTTDDGQADEYDVLEFLALLSVSIPKPGESVTRYYGWYSCRGRGERKKKSRLAAPSMAALSADFGELSRAEPAPKASLSWAQCMKRVLEINPLECPRCGGEMRIVAFLHDHHEIEKIMHSLGIPKSQAPPPMPKASLADAEHIAPEVDYH